MKFKNPFKLTPQLLIEGQLEDTLIDLHQAKMQAHYYNNQIIHLEEKLDLLYDEKEFYDGNPHSVRPSKSVQTAAPKGGVLPC